MDTLYYNDEPYVDHPCEVKIDDGLIEVSYTIDDGKFIYKGHEQTPSIYTLKGIDGCNATLYWSDKAKIMYGDWSQDGLRGLWKITLGKPQSEI